MEIQRVAVTRVRPERRVGQQSTVKQITHSTCLFVEVVADDGTVGIGEIPDIEAPDEIPDLPEVESELERVLLGEDPRRINRLSKRLPSELRLGPYEFHSFQQLTVGAVDMALYDLVGNVYDVPAYQLVGGLTQEVPICWVAFTRRSDDRFQALKAEIREKHEAGFSSFKLKVGEEPVEIDEQRIKTVRDIVGEDADIFIDAQGVWELDEAIKKINRFDEIGIDGVETPTGRSDPSVDAPGYYYDIPLVPSDLAEVRRRTDVPVMEHVLDPGFGLELVEHDAVDVFTAEVCAGGITRAQRVLQIAESAGIDARLGSTVELGPGTLAGATLAAASPAVTVASDLIGPMVYKDSYLHSEIGYSDGHLRPRSAPGFGISIESGE